VVERLFNRYNPGKNYGIVIRNGSNYRNVNTSNPKFSYNQYLAKLKFCPVDGHTTTPSCSCTRSSQYYIWILCCCL